MLKVLDRQKCPKDLWNKAVDEFSGAWAWHRWELLDARATWSRTDDKSFAVLDERDASRLVALIPLALVLTKSAGFIFGPHLEGTGGPIIDDRIPRRTKDKVRAVIAGELERIALMEKARRIDFSCPPLATDLLSASTLIPNPLCHFGCADTSTQTWLLDFSNKNEEQLWNNLEHRCRKQIKKARRNQLSASLVTPDRSMLDCYYALHLETCGRNNIPPHPVDYFSEIFGPVSKAGLVKSCVVKSDTRTLAIHNFLIYKNSALYWTTAGSNDALKLCANDFGIWHAITEFSKSSIDYLECGEAFPGAADGKLKGLNDFKKSFGGTLYPYFRGQVIYRPVTESLMNIARHLRQGRTKK